jgi:hypothetical protein
MSRKLGTSGVPFKPLVNYVAELSKKHCLDEANNQSNEFQLKPLSITHNMFCSPDNLDEIVKEFIENYSYSTKRKDFVVLYHEILSFHPKDSKKLTNQAVKSIVRKYLWLRASKGLTFAKTHFDKDHIHIHILISGNRIASNKQLRLSRYEFQNIQKEMEHFQLEHFPDLDKSVVFNRLKEEDLEVEIGVELGKEDRIESGIERGIESGFEKIDESSKEINRENRNLGELSQENRNIKEINQEKDEITASNINEIEELKDKEFSFDFEEELRRIREVEKEEVEKDIGFEW